MQDTISYSKPMEGARRSIAKFSQQRTILGRQLICKLLNRLHHRIRLFVFFMHRFSDFSPDFGSGVPLQLSVESAD